MKKYGCSLKRVLFICLLLLILKTTLACSESVKITTYYPAPYGVYEEIITQRIAIGGADMPGDISNDAQAYGLRTNELVVADTSGGNYTNMTGMPGYLKASKMVIGDLGWAGSNDGAYINRMLIFKPGSVPSLDNLAPGDLQVMGKVEVPNSIVFTGGNTPSSYDSSEAIYLEGDGASAAIRINSSSKVMIKKGDDNYQSIEVGDIFYRCKN